MWGILEKMEDIESTGETSSSLEELLPELPKHSQQVAARARWEVLVVDREHI